jgi:PhzF family phenazine biosynthesis protein
LGLSETALITKSEREEIYAIRYFFPVTEILLCGHATFAAAKVLFEINA